MTATVLAPGPSLANFKPNGEELIIGVNRAVYHTRCHWWMASDYPLLRDYKIDYPIKLFTNEANACKLPGICPTATEILYKEQLKEFPFVPPAPSWALLSATSALVLAAHLGATQIDVYGVDWKGTADWDGHEYGDSNSPNQTGWQGNEAWRTRGNWDSQITLWNEVVSMLGGRGASVIRQLQNQSCSQAL